jgi:cytochrome c biogenesis protein CcdA
MKQFNIRLILGIIMVFIYLGMALLVLFSDFFNMSPAFRIIIGILFLVYGIFRGYRLFRMNM